MSLLLLSLVFLGGMFAGATFALVGVWWGLATGRRRVRPISETPLQRFFE